MAGKIEHAEVHDCRRIEAATAEQDHGLPLLLVHARLVL